MVHVQREDPTAMKIGGGAQPPGGALPPGHARLVHVPDHDRRVVGGGEQQACALCPAGYELHLRHPTRVPWPYPQPVSTPLSGGARADDTPLLARVSQPKATTKQLAHPSTKEVPRSCPPPPPPPPPPSRWPRSVERRRRRRWAGPLMRRSHPQFRDKNRRDIGKSQSIFTDSKMETARSQIASRPPCPAAASSPPRTCIA
jgi:hypothetical protein